MAAATVRQRIAQMVTWLEANHPTPYPVEVKWVPKIAAARDDSPAARKAGYVGSCYWDRGKIRIRLSTRLCGRSFGVAYDTLRHEWAHAVVMPNERVYRHPARNKSEHPDEWGVAYARIYRGWVDEGGHEESKRGDP